MIRINLIFYRAALLILSCLWISIAQAQNNNLDRHISINVKQMKLADLLTEIGKKGNFYFSYGSDMIRTDSLVTLTASDKTIRVLLDELFNNNVAYKEAPGYIILRPAPNRLTLVPDTTNEAGINFIITGFVADDVTGKKLQNASVYEKHLLASALTDERGFFKLKLKTTNVITLTVSKEMYKDTSVSFLSKVTVLIRPYKYSYRPDTGSVSAERSWWGRVFISSKMKVQSLNVGEFISDVPAQTSLLPGIGSHGLMGSQIVNNFSFNVLGGYNAGVNGFELGGLYNLNKQDVKYVQVAGLFNVLGGNFSGVQVAGINNVVYKDAKGVEVAGIFNEVKQNSTGVQVAGIANMAGKTATGLQVAGIVNKAVQNSDGMQVAGLTNITGKTATSFQVAGLVNKAHILNGVHIAPVNVADTLKGCAINLMSFSRNGYHQLVAYTDENYTTTLGFKTGNANLYSKLIGGIGFTGADTYYTYGIGFGHDFLLNKGLTLSSELSAQLLQSPDWNNRHQLDRLNVLLAIPVATKLSVFLGPSLNFYDLGQNNTPDEQQAIVKNKAGLTGIGQSFKGWAGWSVGVALF